MGSYGIGPSRLVAAIIEASHDENGIIWPEVVAPFDVGLINMKAGDAECDRVCGRALRSAAPPPARTCSTTTPTSAPGGKFATADLIGLPWQVIVGPRGVAAGEVEIKNRKTGERETLPIADVAQALRCRRMSAGDGSEAGSDRRRAVLGLRADGGVALSAVAAQGDGHLGHRLHLLPRHHAGRRDADHRHGGDERLPRRAADPHPRRQRPSDRAADRHAARRLRRRRRPHQRRARRQIRHSADRGPGAGVRAMSAPAPARWCAASAARTSARSRSSPTTSSRARSSASTPARASPSAAAWPTSSGSRSATRSR